jgi:hypothetical protein
MSISTEVRVLLLGPQYRLRFQPLDSTTTWSVIQVKTENRTGNFIYMRQLVYAPAMDPANS